MSSKKQRVLSRRRRFHPAIWAAIAVAVVVSGYASARYVPLSAPVVAAAPPTAAVAPLQDEDTAPQDFIPNEEWEANLAVRVVKVYVTRYGFEPSEMTVPEGDHILVISNGSGDPGVDVTVRGVVAVPDSGTPAGKTDAPAPGPTVDVPVALGTDRAYARRTGFRQGTVVLDDRNHPDWRCTITVTR
jgi:hypothetical protein